MPRLRTDERTMLPRSTRMAIFDASGGVCAHCGAKLDFYDNFTVEHVIPLAKGGKNDPENYVALCETCNKQKADDIIPPAEYFKYLPKNRLKDLKKMFNNFLRSDDFLDLDNLFLTDWFTICPKHPVPLRNGNLYFMNDPMDVKKLRPQEAYEGLMPFTGRLSFEDKTVMATSPEGLDTPYYKVTKNGKNVLIFSAYMSPGGPDDNGWPYVLDIDFFFDPELKIRDDRLRGPILYEILAEIIDKIQTNLTEGSRGTSILMRMSSPASGPFVQDVTDFFGSFGAELYDVERRGGDAIPGNRVRVIEHVLFAGSKKELSAMMKANNASNFRELSDAVSKESMQEALEKRLEGSKKVEWEKQKRDEAVAACEREPEPPAYKPPKPKPNKTKHRHRRSTKNKNH